MAAWTAASTSPSSRVGSTASPRSWRTRRSRRTGLRGRLPTWVTRMRSSLVIAWTPIVTAFPPRACDQLAVGGTLPGPFAITAHGPEHDIVGAGQADHAEPPRYAALT